MEISKKIHNPKHQQSLQTENECLSCMHTYDCRLKSLRLENKRINSHDSLACFTLNIAPCDSWIREGVIPGYPRKNNEISRLSHNLSIHG